MKTKEQIIRTICLSLFIGIALTGCSDNDIIVSSSGNNITNSPAEEFFPLNEGYSTIYEISYAGGSSELTSFKVGGEVPFNGSTAIEWFSYDNYGTDTGFYQVFDSAIIYYPSRNSSAETIIKLPFAVGFSWDRTTSDIIVDTTGGFDDDISGTKLDTNFVDTTDGGGSNKLLPIEGSSIMTIEQKESIELSDGTYYSGAYRVQVPNSATTSNYYWFVAEIGLVKYSLDAPNGDYSNGKVVGELVSYGTKGY